MDHICLAANKLPWEYELTIEHQILAHTDSLRGAIKRLDAARIKLVALVDEDGVLTRTVTDGDIRRVLVAGGALSDSLTTLPERAPVSFPVGTEPHLLQEALEQHRIHAVVLTDEQNRPVEFVDRHVLKRNIFLSPPDIGDAEAKYVARAFAENYIAPTGSNLSDFEDALESHSGSSQAIAVTSGTAGLHLAVRSLALRPGERVYTSDKTFAASLQPILYENLVPVLIDSEPNSWNMSPQALARALEADAKNGELPKAILLVHLYGQPPELSLIMEIANSYDIPVIEDAAESMGALYQNQPSGTHGLIGVYSFNGNKIITTSGGGAIVTQDPEIAERIRYLSTQGRDPGEHYQHSDIAYNYRMSNVLAGIGLGQLEQLPQRVEKRRKVYDFYKDKLGPIPGISFQMEPKGAKGNRWLTVVNLDPNAFDIHPYQLMRQLRAKGIETRPSWKPMHLQPLAHKFRFAPHSDESAVSASLFLRSLCLPSGSSLTQEQQEFVCDSIKELLTQGDR